jgi:hypothetical protein
VPARPRRSWHVAFILRERHIDHCAWTLRENLVQLAILFWFYKFPEICENRLKILRHYNPEIQIFGLYGGDPQQSDQFESRLKPFLNDFYIFREDRSPHWRWYHGDRMIAHWFAQHGHVLSWDTIFIAQWDMLVFADIKPQLSCLRRGELLLSGLRPIKEVDPWWWYIRPDSPERIEFENFMSFVKEEHAYRDEPICCEFIVACLPREFLSKYVGITNPELGFLEYKIPIYAQIFGIPLRIDHPHQPWWGDDPSTRNASLFARALNSETQNVPLRVIDMHRAMPWGRRIFHPVFDIYPLSVCERAKKIWLEIYVDEIKKRWWRLYASLTR